jgi:hypothetical protein
MFKRARWNLFHDDIQDEDAPVDASSSDVSDSDASDDDDDVRGKMARASAKFAARAQRGYDIDSNSSDSEVFRAADLSSHSIWYYWLSCSHLAIVIFAVSTFVG